MSLEYNRSQEIVEKEINFQKIREESKEKEEEVMFFSFVISEDEKFYDEIVNDDYMGTKD